MNALKSMYHPSDFGLQNWNSLNSKTVTPNSVKAIPLTLPMVELRRKYRIKHGRPAPNAAHWTNLMRNVKLPKKILGAFNERLVTGAFTGRIQQKGTCWFQAILNGWLLSRFGRSMIRERLNAFKKSSNFRSLTKNQLMACPSRKHLSQSYFWSYVEHMLSPANWKRNILFRSNVMRGIQFPEGKLIRSSGLRSNSQNVIGGTAKDVFKFNDILFQGHQNSYISTRAWAKGDGPIERSYRHYKTENSVLSHAFIVSSGHAITGYIGFDNKPMIFDSNFPRPYALDWVKYPEAVLGHFQTHYNRSAKEFILVLTYVKRFYKRSNVPRSPETRKFNMTKYNNKRVNRYNRNNYERLFNKEFEPENFNKKNLSLANKIRLLRFTSFANSNLFSMPKYFRPELRRRYRLKYGRHAPGNISNEKLVNTLRSASSSVLS